MDRKIKYGTIGTSWITEEFIRGATQSDCYELYGVYSRDIKKAEAMAAAHGAAAAYDSLEAMAECGIEAVYIASPNGLHYEQTLYFLNRGIHVICEKPAATKPGQLAEMFQTADKNGVFLFEAFRHINSPGFQVIKEHLAAIGPVRNVLLTYNQYSSRYDAFKAGEEPNIFNPAFDGGALMDLGIYPISFAIGLFGKPDKIIGSRVALRNGVDGVGAVIFDYQDFLCTISYSKIAEDVIWNQILGEKGAIHFEKPTRLGTLSLRLRGEEAKDISVKQYENTMRHEAEVFSGIIRGGDTNAYKKLASISQETNKILMELKA